jgi:hypothetical protein
MENIRLCRSLKRETLKLVDESSQQRTAAISKWAYPVEGEKTGDGISYASHVKNPNPLKARATTFYDPVHNALD